MENFIILIILWFGIIAIYLVISFLISLFSPSKPTILEDYSPINLAKETIEDYTVRATKLFLQGKYQKALSMCVSILNINPNSFEALSVRAMCYENLNDNLKAIKDYEKALSLNPNESNTLGLLGLLYHKINEFDKGQENLKKSVDLGCETYKGIYILNMKEEAIKCIEKAFKK